MSNISLGFSSLTPSIGDPVSVHDIDNADGIHEDGIITQMEGFRVTEIFLERSKVILSFRGTGGDNYGHKWGEFRR